MKGSARHWRWRRATVVPLLVVVASACQPSRNERVAEFRQKLAEVAIKAPVDLEAVARIFGSELSAAKEISSSRTEWQFAPSALLDKGTGARGGSWTHIVIVPASSLQLTFQDVDGALLDNPYQ